MEPGLACYTNNGDLTDKIVKKSHRTIQLWNKKCLYSIEIKKGDAIGQGIFQKYYSVDNDNAQGERLGGFGSTSK